MKLMETNVSGSSVRMQFANDPNPALATEWLEFEAPIDLLKTQAASPLSDPSARRLVVVQLALLHQMRDAIDEEVRRFESTAQLGLLN
jgi:hypothetical protein